MAEGPRRPRGLRPLFQALQRPLLGLQRGGGLEEVAEIARLLAPRAKLLGRASLLNSPEAWEVLVGSYDQDTPESSMLDYFWTWRALMGGMFSVMTTPLPRAAIYHTISTGYAGLLAARAKLETGIQPS